MNKDEATLYNVPRRELDRIELQATLDATTKEGEKSKIMNTHHLVCDFGRHSGTLYTRMPVSYLLWMLNSQHSRADIAKAELERRGTTVPELDVSGHAIDRASTDCRDIWHKSKLAGEGINSWLIRMSQEALAENDKDEEGRYYHNGMRFVFQIDGAWPVLKTIMRHKPKKEEG